MLDALAPCWADAKLAKRERAAKTAMGVFMAGKCYPSGRYARHVACGDDRAGVARLTSFPLSLGACDEPENLDCISSRGRLRGTAGRVGSKRHDRDRAGR